MSKKAIAALATMGALFSVHAEAGTVTIDLGVSTQNYVLYGQGAYAPGLGSFTNQQGDESYDAGTNTTTDTLTGTITGSNVAGLATGTYSFVTSYTGTPIGSGGSQLESISNASNSNFFNYSSIDPSLNMVLTLFTTTSGTQTIALVTNGVFDGPGFSFTFPTANCTGVATCDQNSVGLTPGASEYGPTTISISYTTPAPEPATWGLMILGIGGVGGMLRRNRIRLASA